MSIHLHVNKCLLDRDIPVPLPCQQAYTSPPESAPSSQISPRSVYCISPQTDSLYVPHAAGYV